MCALEQSQSNEVWLSNREAWRYLGVSKATFYRKIYRRLITDPATRWLDGHPRYQRSQVDKLLVAEPAVTLSTICAKPPGPSEAVPISDARTAVHAATGPTQPAQKRPRRHSADSAGGQLVLLVAPEAS